MNTYFQQLQEDQSALQAMLERRRAFHEQSSPPGNELIEDKMLRPSVRLLNQCTIQMLEDMISVNGSLLEYFTPKEPVEQ